MERSLSKCWDLLPDDVQVLILAWLSCADLFRSCLLVCKKWKILILFSETLAKLQYRPWNSMKTLLRFKSRKLRFSYDSYNQVLEMTVNYHYAARFGRGGLICLKHYTEKTLMVGNPLKNAWRTIAVPDSHLSVVSLHVDASSSPPSYKILAIPVSFANPSACTQVYDSRIDSWTKGQTLDWEAAIDNEIMCHSAFECNYKKKKIALYDFDHDKWNLLKYIPPETIREEDFVCYKQGLILITYPSWSIVRLWKGNSCCNGVIQWGLMAELDFEAFLFQKGLDARRVRFGPFKELVESSITFTVDLFSEKLVLVHYDIIKVSLQFGGIKPGIGDHYVNFVTGLMTP